MESENRIEKHFDGSLNTKSHFDVGETGRRGILARSTFHAD